jgi:hypothetical protein
VLTPFLFSLLLLIVFFIWVNVMVAIISEVYQQECDRSLNIQWDEDFDGMQPGVPQPQNDLQAMYPHHPVQSVENEPPPPPVALTPDRCCFHAFAARASAGGHRCTAADWVQILPRAHGGLGPFPRACDGGHARALFCPRSR